MLQNEPHWQEQLQKYHFNAIMFYYLDRTEWAQAFFKRRLADKTWAPVFVDSSVIIFLLRNEENNGVITEFENPKERLLRAS